MQHDGRIKAGLGFLSGQRVLVTGANGFIGRYLLDLLVDSGARVYVLDKMETESRLVEKSYRGDMRDATFVSDSVMDSRPQIIYHLAAFKKRSSEFTDFSQEIDVNLIGTLNLLTPAARLEGLQSVVVLGTCEEYGHSATPFAEGVRELPVNAYSFSKLCVTHLCQVMKAVYKMPLVVLRPSVAYGPGQAADMFLSSLLSTLLEGKPFKMTAGTQTRDYIYI